MYSNPNSDCVAGKWFSVLDCNPSENSACIVFCKHEETEHFEYYDYTLATYYNGGFVESKVSLRTGSSLEVIEWRYLERCPFHSQVGRNINKNKVEKPL